MNVYIAMSDEFNSWKRTISFLSDHDEVHILSSGDSDAIQDSFKKNFENKNVKYFTSDESGDDFFNAVLVYVLDNVRNSRNAGLYIIGFKLKENFYNVFQDELLQKFRYIVLCKTFSTARAPKRTWTEYLKSEEQRRKSDEDSSAAMQDVMSGMLKSRSAGKTGRETFEKKDVNDPSHSGDNRKTPSESAETNDKKGQRDKKERPAGKKSSLTFDDIQGVYGNTDPPDDKKDGKKGQDPKEEKKSADPAGEIWRRDEPEEKKEEKQDPFLRSREIFMSEVVGRFRQHVALVSQDESKGGMDLSGNEITNFIMLILKTENPEQFMTSWKAIYPLKPFELKAEEFKLLQEEAVFMGMLSELLYEKDKYGY